MICDCGHKQELHDGTRCLGRGGFDEEGHAVFCKCDDLHPPESKQSEAWRKLAKERRWNAQQPVGFWMTIASRARDLEVADTLDTAADTCDQLRKFRKVVQRKFAVSDPDHCTTDSDIYGSINVAIGNSRAWKNMLPLIDKERKEIKAENTKLQATCDQLQREQEIDAALWAVQRGVQKKLEGKNANLRKLLATARGAIDELATQANNGCYKDVIAAIDAKLKDS